MQKPLAEILRPKTMDQYIGQSHLMGEGASLRRAIENNNLHSMILWGPPGVGKTTLALLMAELTHAQFYMLSAINSGVKDIRDIIEKATKEKGKSILFIDEIHRFSKSQQDSLLGAVEQGVFTLIGATTENPSFEVISPLLSRCQVYLLKNLEKNELEKIIQHSVSYLEQERHIKINIKETEALLRLSGGDARKLINAIELVVNILETTTKNITIDNSIVQQIIQKNLALYDKKGENHYDIISAFIKSVRGSDPNAAVYWLARMLDAGEDPLFIARRLIILASEDIGNANPNALLLANNCFQAVHQIGMPEARIVLSQTTIYIASSPKSNASYLAIDEALDWVKKTGDLAVPLHLRNAPTQLMKDLGYHDGYQYAHNYEQNFVNQEFLPQEISGKKFYEPQNNARENELRKYLRNCWKDKYRYIILIIAMLSISMQLLAQDIHYSQFSANPLYLNPANTGAIDGVFQVGFNQRTQWLSVTKPYVGFDFSADAPIYKSNGRRHLLGIGAQFQYDQAGDSHLQAIQGNLFLSFTQALDRKNIIKWSLGGYIGILQRSINYHSLTFDEQYRGGMYASENPIHEMLDKDKLIVFDCGIGTNFHITPSKRYRINCGVSISHLTKPNLSLFHSQSRLPIKATGYLLAHLSIIEHFCISPMLMTAFQNKYQEINFGCHFEYELYKKNYSNRIAAGIGLYHRIKDAVIICATAQWENIRLGISYDINISTLTVASKGRGAFELSLYYIFKRKSVRKTGNEPCPFEFM